MVMNGKEDMGKRYEWNTLMGVSLPTLLSEKRLVPGQAREGQDSWKVGVNRCALMLTSGGIMNT